MRENVRHVFLDQFEEVFCLGGEFFEYFLLSQLKGDKGSNQKLGVCVLDKLLREQANGQVLLVGAILNNGLRLRDNQERGAESERVQLESQAVL